MRIMVSIAALATIGFLGGVAAPGMAAELPQRFLGVWIAESTPKANEICSKSDWGRAATDRLVLVEPRRILAHESVCIFTSINLEKSTNPTGTSVRINQTCEGEGEKWKGTSVWDIKHTLMVHTDSKDPSRPQIYQKCP